MWGAWLQASPDKKIVAQDPWYGPKLSSNDQKICIQSLGLWRRYEDCDIRFKWTNRIISYRISS